MISMVTHGDVDQVTNSGTTALLRRRLPTRACQFRMALPLCGDQETFQANGPTYVDSSSHRIQTMSGRHAVTARSKSIAMFSAFDPLTRAATTSFGSTFHTPTLAWLTNTVLATLSAASKTGGRARQEAIHTTTCDHSLCAGKRSHPYDNTKSHAAIRARERVNPQNARGQVHIKMFVE